jgi:ketosteroid isomerase-like protein
MRSLSRTIAVSLILAVVVGCANQTSDLSEADKNAVKAQVEKYRQASLASDWDTWGNTLASDVQVFPPNMQPLNGRAAAVAWVKTFPKLTGFTVNIEEVSGHGDVAYDRGTYELKMSMPDGSSASDHGVFLEVHRRQSDGTWPYTRLMFHSTDPLPAPATSTAPPKKP